MNTQLERGAAPAILFVRSLRHLDLALEQVNRFLAFRRDRHHAYDRIVAVCIRRDLDSGLPLLMGSLSMAESSSLAGVWTLSWMSGMTWRNVNGTTGQREVILRTFFHSVSKQDSLGSVYPVFAADEPPETVAAGMKRLKEQHFQIDDGLEFRQDASCRLYLESGDLGSTARTARTRGAVRGRPN